MTPLATFDELGLQVLERGWLSSNNIVFAAATGAPATVVDTGYGSHAEQTVALIDAATRGQGVERAVNTHLHSDHCGGNALLQQRWGCETRVPAMSLDAVTRWDEARLTYRATGQRCERFRADGALHVGQQLRLGAHAWDVLPAPGHDPESVMFFQRDSRVLISADALWESRLAIIFPVLSEEGGGFGEAGAALDAIACLDPDVVIPGHGAPFTHVRQALACSRQRLDAFERDPPLHRSYAERALTMFHMLEHRTRPLADLLTWLQEASLLGLTGERADAVVEGLLRSGQLVRRGADIAIASTQ